MPARQFLRNKPHGWGIKSWALAESETGYVLNCELYCGKVANRNGDHNSPSEVVKRLTQPYNHQGRTVYMDNLFSAVDLFLFLYDNGFMACGTLRENRKNMPRDIVGKQRAAVKRLRRGESLWRQAGKLYCVTGLDTKPVVILSTMPTDTNSNPPVARSVKQNGVRSQVEIPRSEIIGQYNSYMDGIDLADKKVMAYRRQTKGLRWFHKVLWYLMDICVLNVFVMYNASRDPEYPLLLREFREQIATKLIGGRLHRKAGDYARQDDEKRLNHITTCTQKDGHICKL